MRAMIHFEISQLEKEFLLYYSHDFNAVDGK